VYGLAAYVLIALRVYLAATVSYLHYVTVHASVGTPAARKPLTAVKAATASRSNYSFTTAETSGSIYAGHSVTSITKIYGSIPGGPSTSAILFYNPHGRTAAIFYLSSRRQPTSAPSCFSLSNHVSSTSGTPTYAVHLLRPVNPSRQLRRRQRHAPTTALPLPKRRAKFMQVTAFHPLPSSTAVLPHPPSCSTNSHGGIAAKFYYQSSRRQPTLSPTSAPSCFFTFQPRPVFLRHCHLCITATLTPTSPYLHAILFFTFQPRQVFLNHSHYGTLG